VTAIVNSGRFESAEELGAEIKRLGSEEANMEQIEPSSNRRLSLSRSRSKNNSNWKLDYDETPSSLQLVCPFPQPKKPIF
jgi:hypothetical protein